MDNPIRTHSFFIASLLGLVLLCITSQSSRVIQTQPETFRFQDSIARDIPGTGNHPGNVYVLGETLRIAMPVSNFQDIHQWRALNDAGEIVQTGRIEGAADEDVNLGALGVGWYRVEFLDDD